MNPTEQGMNPDQLQRYVMDSLVPHADELTADQWNEVKVFNGEKLYKTGFWNLLYRVLTSEAYQFMDDAGGYYTNVANSNSVLSLPVFEFGPKVKYRTLVAGYEALPRAVGQAFIDDQGRLPPQLPARLVGQARRRLLAALRAHRDRRAGAPTRAPCPAPRRRSRCRRSRSCSRCRAARSSWCAGTRSSSDQSVRELINAVISQAAFKIFLGYPYPWWRVLGLRPAARSPTCRCARPSTSRPRARRRAPIPPTTTR